MSRERIDSIEAIDRASVTLAELQWLYGTGVSSSKGSGRNKTHSYRRGVMTALGDIQEDLWYQLVNHIAKRDQEEWIVDALFTWHQEHNYQKESPSQLRCAALQSYSSRIWELPQWVDYLPFNRRFFPQMLDKTRIVTVVNSCCDKPGEVTQEQIDRAWCGQISCPHCGRWSFFVVCNSSVALPWDEFLFHHPYHKDQEDLQ